MKIKKLNEEVTYRRSESTIELLVNDKKVRVYVHEDSDDMTGSDYDIDEADKKLLTEDEYDELTDQDIWELVRMTDGDILNTESDLDPNNHN